MKLSILHGAVRGTVTAHTKANIKNRVLRIIFLNKLLAVLKNHIFFEQEHL